MKIRLHGTEDECLQLAGRLAAVVDVLAVSVVIYADRGASRLARVYVEARLSWPPAASQPAPSAPGELPAGGRS